MKTLCSLVLSFALLLPAPLKAQAPDERAAVIVVIGAGGKEEYERSFGEWAANWEKAGKAAEARITVIGRGPSENDRVELEKALHAETTRSAPELWIVLLGHGTWDGKEAKFNLRGDDVSAPELAKWLEPIHAPTAVLAAFSSSGAFLKPLAASNRVILTATKSGSENNYARFGEYLSGAVFEPDADIDKDGQVSLLEMWLTASQKTAAFYENEGRLATEHALLDDNGDGLGTPADWFRGVRAVKRAKDGAAPDGLRAHQLHLIRNPSENALPAAVRAERDAIELQIAKLRDAKETMPEDAYYKQLEPLLLKLARLYKQNPTGD